MFCKSILVVTFCIPQPFVFRAPSVLLQVTPFSTEVIFIQVAAANLHLPSMASSPAHEITKIIGWLGPAVLHRATMAQGV